MNVVCLVKVWELEILSVQNLGDHSPCEGSDIDMMEPMTT